MSMKIHFVYKEKFNSKLGVELEYTETKTLGFKRYDPYQIVYGKYDFTTHSFSQKEEKGQKNSSLEIIDIFEDYMIYTYPDLAEKEVVFEDYNISASVSLNRITLQEAMSKHKYTLQESFFKQHIKELKNFVDKFKEENITVQIW